MKFFKSLLVLFSAVTLMSCQKKTPSEFNLGKDQCDNCKMTISDKKYAAELITEKGRIYKFDDVHCMKNYIADNPESTKNAQLFVIDFNTGKFIDARNAFYAKGGNIKSPMGGNSQAFSDQKGADQAAKMQSAQSGKY